MKSTIGRKITNEEANAINTINDAAFTKENIVLTDEGYKTIEDLSVGDLVLTTSNTFSKVKKKEYLAKSETIIVHGMGIDYVTCTPNQQFLVREHVRNLWSKTHQADERPSGLRVFSDPKYVCAKDLTSKHYMGIQILPFSNNALFETDNLDFWWLCGTYVGDGCMDLKQRRAIITCNDNDIKRLEPALERLQYDYKIHPKEYERGCFNVTIKNDDFAKFVDEVFGHYSYGKKIPYKVINLPEPQLNAFYTGFLQSDGCTLKTNPNMSQFTSVNRNLTSATCLIINKLFRRPTRLYYQIRPDKYIIEGRVVNQRNSYQIRFLKEKEKFEHAFIENDYIWFPFSKLEEGPIDDLYKIELEDGEGFIVGNCVIKN